MYNRANKMKDRLRPGLSIARKLSKKGLPIEQVQAELQERGYYAARYEPEGNTLTVGYSPDSATALHPNVKDVKLTHNPIPAPETEPE